MFVTSIALLALGGLSFAGPVEKRQASSSTTSSSSSTTTPDYFQITPEIFNGESWSHCFAAQMLTLRSGPTQTGAPPFLAQTNPAPFAATKSFVANSPLETAVPIADAGNRSIFQLLGQLSSYFPNPE